MGHELKTAVPVAELERGLRHLTLHRKTVARGWQEVRLATLCARHQLSATESVDVSEIGAQSPHFMAVRPRLSIIIDR